jgi:membrane fusion protein (multidrug efflux system)
MTRGCGHREAEGASSPGELRAYVGSGDRSVDLLGRPQHPPEVLDAQPDRGGLTQQLPLWGRLRRNSLHIAAVAIAIAIVLVGTAWWWFRALQYESTDDAFIDNRKVQVASALNGIVVEVPVTDNQLVDPGGVLVRIDPRDYETALAQAEAQVEQASAAVSNLDAQIDAQNARIDQARDQVMQAQAAYDFAKAENDRAQTLLKSGSGTLQQAQQTQTNLRQAEATLASAQANLTTAEKEVAVLKTQREGAAAQLEQARAALSQAETNLSRTLVLAPETGRTTSIFAAKGAYAVAGQALMMFVPQYAWVTANFKETQLDQMRPGQPVDIRIDAYPGKSFAGHVDSIQPGSGAAFSLLPPQNATGNYVKVVQRVPVKIVFDTPPDVYVGPGMSVVPTVKVR